MEIAGFHCAESPSQSSESMAVGSTSLMSRDDLHPGDPQFKTTIFDRSTMVNQLIGRFSTQQPPEEQPRHSGVSKVAHVHKAPARAQRGVQQRQAMTPASDCGSVRLAAAWGFSRMNAPFSIFSPMVFE